MLSPFSHVWFFVTASNSSVLAWSIPGTAEPGGLPTMGSHRVGHDRSNLAAAAAAVWSREAWTAAVLGVTKSWTRLSGWAANNLKWMKFHFLGPGQCVSITGSRVVFLWPLWWDWEMALSNSFFWSVLIALKFLLSYFNWSNLRSGCCLVRSKEVLFLCWNM